MKLIPALILILVLNWVVSLFGLPWYGRFIGAMIIGILIAELAEWLRRPRAPKDE